MTRKSKVTLSAQQKLEYAKLMVEEGYTNKQIEEMSGAGKSAVSRWKQQYLSELDDKCRYHLSKALATLILC